MLFMRRRGESCASAAVYRSIIWALLSSAALIPISLFVGFVMLRTGNIVAPGLAHTFANWIDTLGY
ncbi:MAG: hypothetical protein RBT01_14510 [Anaerolineaceae bacterium]|nr:hypothetical protein [Anaerolineaceae bacterium]